MTHPAPGSAQRTFLGLGSNLGDRRAHLAAALAALPDVVGVSGVYETDPVGGPEQPTYLNCVVELDTAATPEELLSAARAAEAAADRERTVRWGPRTLDVDVLLVGDHVRDGPELTVPHPRMFERAFVLVPLADLAPEIAGPHLERLGRADPAAVAGVRPAGRLTG